MVTSLQFKRIFFLFISISSLLLSSCDSDDEQREQQQVLTMALFAALPGWESDQHQEAWPALLKNCRVMRKKEKWKEICQKAASMPNPDRLTAKQFFEQHFTPKQLFSPKGGDQGFMTGYYEPLLMGSHEKTERFRYPLYQTPKSLLIVDLSSLYPELKGKRIRGRLEGNKVLPFYSRAEIDGEKQPLTGEEILWVDSLSDIFFLQIQGSGRVQLPDGNIIGAGYANQNGHPYVSIGKRLIEWGELEPGKVNLFILKKWLKNNPERATKLLNENPSYVFFNLRDNVSDGPIGSLNVPLTAERSIAVDRKHISLGSLLWVDSRYPSTPKGPLQKLVFAQDTGGAIRGELRADFFFGSGKQAERWAGTMKQKTRFYLLQPKAGTQ